MQGPEHPDTIDLFYTVYLDGPPPSEDDLDDALDVWLDTHADPPWPALVRRMRGTRGLQLALVRREDAPPIQPAGFHLNAKDRERLERASWVMAIAATDTPLAPRPGLVAASACAMAVAHSFDGIVVDPGASRAFTAPSQPLRLRASGALPVAEHVAVHLVDRGFHYTTRGMAKFGLPELSLSVGLTPDDGPASLLLGAAQALSERVADGRAPAARFLPEVLRIHRACVDRALGRPESPRREVVELSLLHDPTGRLGLMILPPAGVELATWRSRSSAVLGRATGEDPMQAQARAERLWRAHDRAANEFPRIWERARFGVAAGTEFYVRRAFPAPDGRRVLVWVGVTACDPEVVGYIADEAGARFGLQLGNVVRFPLYEVYDWMLRTPDGRTQGAYTTDIPRNPEPTDKPRGQAVKPA